MAVAIVAVTLVLCVAVRGEDAGAKASISCGLSSLAAIRWLATGNTSDSLPEVSSSLSALSFTDLRDAAGQLGIPMTGVQASLDELCHMECSAVAQVDGDHFLVIERVLGSCVRIIDSFASVAVVPRAELQKRYGGRALVPTESVTSQAGQARVWADSYVTEVGEVGANSEVSTEFVVRTASATPISVVDIRACCGAQVQSVSGRVISADKPLEIGVGASAPALPGPWSKTITLLLDRPHWPVMNLSIAGAVAGSPMVSPAAVDFGETDRGRVVQQVVTLAYVDAKRCDELALSSTAESVAVRKTDYDAARQTLKLVVSLDSSSLRGRVVAAVVVRLGTGKGEAEMRVPVYADVKTPVTVMPAVLALGLVRQRSLGSAAVKLARTNGESMKILQIKAPRGVLVRCTSVDGGWVLRASTTSDAPQGVMDDYVVVGTDVPGDDIIRIPLSAAIEKSSL